MFDRDWPALVSEIALPGPCLIGPRDRPFWSEEAIEAWRWARSWRSADKAQIQLSRGMIAIVDADEAAALAAFKWHAVPRSDGKGFYAARSLRGGARVWMHRAILAAPEALLVDHRDGDGLNNRRRNLRVATVQQNVWNRRLTTTRFRGVQAAATGWRARIHAPEGTLSLGIFPTPEAAARAYDAAARRLRGEFAALNFPEEQA